jgi:hypothetical protein
MEFSGQQCNSKCWILKVDVVGSFRNCVEMKIYGRRGCVPGSNMLFEIHQGSTCFATGKILVATIEFVRSQQVEFLSNLWCLGGEWNDWGIVRSEGGFHPLGCACWWEEIWWTRISCENLIVERGILSNLRDHRLLWIDSLSSRVAFCCELEPQVYGWVEHFPSIAGCIFLKINVLICYVYSC